MPRNDKPTASSKNIAAELRGRILSRHYKNNKLPSKATLAKEFKCSLPTIARALGILSAEKIVEIRAGSGTYVLKDRPRKALEVKTGLLAMLAPITHHTDVFKIIGGEIDRLARHHGYHFVWGEAGQPRQDDDLDRQRVEKICRYYIDNRFEGVFFAPSEFTPGQLAENSQIANQLRDGGIQVVLIDRDLKAFPSRSDFDLVGLDNFAAGYQLAEHLCMVGCEDFKFVMRPLSAPTVRARIAGVLELLAQKKIKVSDELICEGDADNPGFVETLLVPNLPDAIICANDFTAAKLLRSLHKRKIAVPRQIKVVGVDNMDYTSALSPPLTTIAYPCSHVAIAAFRVMMDRLSNPAMPSCSIALTPRLECRESSMAG